MGEILFFEYRLFSRRPPEPSVWCVDDHQPLQANAPKEVTLLHRAGQQSGLGRWPGLEDKLLEVFGNMFWPSYTPHVNHTCDVCTKPFTFAGAALEFKRLLSMESKGRSGRSVPLSVATSPCQPSNAGKVYSTRSFVAACLINMF